MGVVLLQTGRITTVLKAAALQCFHTLSLAQLQIIAQEQGVVVQGVPSLASVLGALIRKVLDPITDDEVLGILALRSVELDNPMEILTDDVAEEILDSMDLQTLAEQLKKVADRKAEAKAFRDSVAAGHAGAVGGGGGGSGAAEGERSAGGRKIVSKLNLYTAKQYCPPHTVLFHDPMCHRIRGYYCFGGSRPSRGCLLAHGQDTACKVVLKWLWEKHRSTHPNVEIPYEFPIKEDEGDAPKPRGKAARLHVVGSAASSTSRAKRSRGEP